MQSLGCIHQSQQEEDTHGASSRSIPPTQSDVTDTRISTLKQGSPRDPLAADHEDQPLGRRPGAAEDTRLPHVLWLPLPDFPEAVFILLQGLVGEEV